MNIAAQHIIEEDQEFEKAISVDEFAMRRGELRSNFGMGSSIAHYLGLFPIGNVLVFHSKMSPSGKCEIQKIKVLGCCRGHPQKCTQNYVGNMQSLHHNV